ncbi:MAG: DUF2802 domain-containing protein [Woeseiaceae bacterium]
MTMTNDYFFLTLLLVSNGFLLAVATIAVLRFERRWQRLESFWDSPTGAALSDAGDEELHEQMEATQRLEQQLGELQVAVKLMDRKAPQERPPIERNLPIENAVRMARLGASVEDLTRNCGLNVGEARLLKKLHGREPLAANGH